MNHQYHASYENIMLRPLERKDIENLRVWRNDATQTRFLRKIDHITPEMQEKWYESYLKDNDVRRHIVGGANRTLFSVDLPPRLCRTGT